MKLTQDRRLQDIAALGVAALVLASVAILQVVTTESTGATNVTTPSVPTHVLGQHFERPPTTAPAASTRTPVSVAPVRSTRVSPSQSKSPPVTRLVTVTSIVDCGNGGATANIALSTIKDWSTGTYVSDGKITVTNSLQRPIQIDDLVVRIDFADGTSDTIRLGDASGATLNTGGDNVLHAPLNTTKEPTAAAIDTLDYHVAGEQRCPGRIR
jgi:hypothetical protein